MVHKLLCERAVSKDRPVHQRLRTNEHIETCVQERLGPALSLQCLLAVDNLPLQEDTCATEANGLPP